MAQNLDLIILVNLKLECELREYLLVEQKENVDLIINNWFPIADTDAAQDTQVLLMRNTLLHQCN